ncbi:hypothetical protein F4677DRAFT_428043 [Hypoxylon crocopeplum]|nr:hypothetical protein F4677DRAFT_428043 [Hypoxylon crocopeplum]
MESSNLHQPMILPLLSLDSGDNFNYTTFLQDDDIDYLGISTVSPPEATGATAKSNADQRQRRERRGHQKSRLGCFSCKRRRIKCQETRPACKNCDKTGLKCEYPAVPQVVHQPQHQIPLFSLQDMRFFQHFLLTCFPHKPLGNETIWTHEIPCLSQNYQYLMHAILGLSASDLMLHDPSLVTFAMTHRLKAIKAIKKTLNEVPKNNTFEEGNALVATCFALTFQSVILDDGMAEFMTFCRGIVLVAIQMVTKGARFLFSNMLGDESTNLLKPYIEALPPIQAEWVDMAVAGIRGLEPLCGHEVEAEYLGFLVEMAEQLRESSFRAYEALCRHYGWWIMMAHERFQYLIDPGNQTCTLLATHWIALKLIMAPVTETEHKLRAQEPKYRDGDMDQGMARWLRYLNRQVDAEHRRFNAWPVWVEEQLDMDMTFFGKTMH